MSASPTVAEAVADLLLHVEEGKDCPCCGQRAQAYKRRVRGNHARFLIDLEVDTLAVCVVNHSQCFFAGRDYNYLVHFGLAEAQHRTGLWRPLPAGIEFVHDRGRIPEWLLIYNNTIIRRAERTVTIRDCMSGGEFDYDALMNGEGS